MPLYDYRCRSCEVNFESVSKPYEPVRCPECGTLGAERMVTSFGGYEIKGDNSSSVRPKGAGSRTRGSE